MWNLLNPMFLWAALAALVPLILHLMQRRRTTRVPISTVRFLKLAQKSSSRRIHMENFLLWLLRTILMLVLAAAFAVPVIRTQGLGNLIGSAHRDVAIIIDVSYSMGYETSQRRVWDTARDAAVAVIEGLRSGDRVSLILADEQTTTLVEKPTGDMATILNLIKNQTVRNGSSRLHEAVEAAVGSLKESKPREREIFIITDGQALPWNGFRNEGAVAGATDSTGAVARASTPATNAPPAVAAVTTGTNAIVPPGVWDPEKIDKDIAFFAILIGPTAPENSYADMVEITPQLLLPDTTPKLTTRVRRNGPAQSVAISLMIDEAEVSRRTLVLEENTAVSIPFAIPALQPGVHAARLVLPADGLTLDDAFHFILRVKRELPVLVVGREKDVFFLDTALNPGANSTGIRAKKIEPEAVTGENLREYSAVFLCNALPLPGQQMLALENYARGGGVLGIFPGDAATPKVYADWACLPAKPVEIVEPTDENRVWSLRLLTKQDPLFNGFTLPPGAVPTIAVKRHLRFDNPADSEGVPVLTALDNARNSAPFLISRNYGKGRVLLFAVSADRVWSTLPITSFFLPVVHQVVQFGAGYTRDPLFFWNARSMLLSDFLPEFTESDIITTPSDKRLSVRAVHRETKVLFEAENVADQGIYQISRSGGPREPVMAINVRREESSLQVIDPSSLALLTGLEKLRTTRDVQELRQLVGEHRRGRPLTEFCFWLALLLALLEIFMANRISRKKSALSEHLDVNLSGRVAAAMKE